MLIEQFYSTGPRFHLYGGNPGSWVNLMNWQHTTIYMFFGISGVVDIFTCSSAKVPMGLDRLMLSIANFVEGLVLFPPWGGPRWDVEDNTNVTFTSICFCWHYATAILVLGLNYALVLWCIQKFGKSTGETKVKLRMQKQQCEEGYHAALLNGSDDE